MIKRFNTSANSDFSSLINNIESNLNCPKYQYFGKNIEIDIWENIQNLMPVNKRVAENGFSFCISDYFECDIKKPLIVVNLENCSSAYFTNLEIEAVIMHELGHLLNSPELEKVTTLVDFMNGKEYHVDLAEEIKKKKFAKKRNLCRFICISTWIWR